MSQPSLPAELKMLSKQITQALQAQTPEKETQAQFARLIFDEVTQALLQDTPEKTHLQAPNAVLEVIAEDGLLYRRYLELGFEENKNGLRLMGENLKGEPAQLVFLSEQAIEQMHDLGGKGLDKPRCK